MGWLNKQKLKYLENRTELFYKIIKILNLCPRWHILRSYCFVAEVNFKIICILCFQILWVGQVGIVISLTVYIWSTMVSHCLLLTQPTKITSAVCTTKRSLKVKAKFRLELSVLISKYDIQLTISKHLYLIFFCLFSHSMLIKCFIVALKTSGIRQISSWD